MTPTASGSTAQPSRPRSPVSGSPTCDPWRGAAPKAGDPAPCRGQGQSPRPRGAGSPAGRARPAAAQRNELTGPAGPTSVTLPLADGALGATAPGAAPRSTGSPAS